MGLKINIKSIILFLLFIGIGLNINNGIGYVVFALITLLSIILIFRKRRIHLPAHSRWDLIPAIICLMWLYGIIRGIYLGNKIEYVFANNAAMIIYILYYLLLQVSIAKERLYKLVLISCVTIGIITTLLFLCYVLGVPQELTNPFLGEYKAGSSTGQLRVYFISQITLFGGISVYLYRLLVPKAARCSLGLEQTKLSKDIFMLAWLTMCVMFFTASKGFMLGYIYILAALFIAVYSKSLSHGKINKKILAFIGLLILLLIILISLGYINIFSAIFDEEDIANIERYEQLNYLFSDLTWLGKGLGAIIPGYSRNDDKPYGFELSYLNLLHKFGIFAFIIVFTYIKVVRRSISYIRNGIQVKYAVLSLGLMAYLLPSIGNPLLFAPQAVIINCIVLLLLNEKEYA